MVNYMDKKSILLLSIEMTRRCNLNCDFCSRGDSQNLDISKEIIDKTLDEVTDMYIHMLQIYGGEPTLAPELFEYLVERIIDTHTQIGYVIFYTNGIIKDKRFLESLKKLLDYVVSISYELKNYIDFFNTKSSKTYKYNNNKKVAVVVASFKHNNKKYLESAMNFYNEIVDDKYEVVLQADMVSGSYAGTLLIEGNAEKNISKIIPNVVSLFIENDGRLRVWSTCNESFVIKDFSKDGIGNSIFSTICVSANGNVYLNPGTSYEHVDDNPIMQIMYCNKDFFYRVEQWCWEHPLLPNLTYIKELCKTVIFCYENNIQTTADIEKEYKRVINEIQPSLQILEEYNRCFHMMYPDLDIEQIQEMTNMKMLKNTKK